MDLNTAYSILDLTSEASEASRMNLIKVNLQLRQINENLL